jgi:hypothetical protein
MAILVSIGNAGFSRETARFLLGHAIVTVCAPAFAFLAIAALQGVLILVVSPRVFRRISPWIQTIGMSLMVLALFTIPIYAAYPAWRPYIPTVWFTGMYDFRGGLGLNALGLAFSIFCITWLTGFRRHYRRTLETEDTASRRPRFSVFHRLPGPPEEQAIFRFSGKTLARSSKHRFFLATYWSAGLSLGLLAAVRVQIGHPGISPDGLRAFPLLIGFFVVSGFRAIYQFPAELGANWVFRLTQSFWSETARAAARKRMFVSGLLPATLLFTPAEVCYWGAVTGALHTLFQLVTGAILIEIFFWSFEKVPFTCPYNPGKVNLSLLAGMFLWGFTDYSFMAADLEHSLDGRPLRILLFFTAAATTLTMCWRYRRAPSQVLFDAEPLVQSLNLS